MPAVLLTCACRVSELVVTQSDRTGNEEHRKSYYQ